ncbi:MAG: hypothetical protein PHV32_05710 [Eubacteriales bacterium]|nr:hypothetical protein [Eubacteriales bacterium]
MMRNRIFALVLVIAFAFSLASCGGKGKDAGPADNEYENEEHDGKKEEDVHENNFENDIYAIPVEKAKLPDELRTDLVPIMKGSKILEFSEDPSMPEFFIYNITCCSELPYEAVMSFYKEYLSHFDVVEEDTKEGQYFVHSNLDEDNSIQVIIQDIGGKDSPHLPKGTYTYFELMYRRPHK